MGVCKGLWARPLVDVSANQISRATTATSSGATCHIGHRIVAEFAADSRLEVLDRRFETVVMGFRTECEACRCVQQSDNREQTLVPASFSVATLTLFLRCSNCDIAHVYMNGPSWLMNRSNRSLGSIQHLVQPTTWSNHRSLGPIQHLVQPIIWSNQLLGPINHFGACEPRKKLAHGSVAAQRRIVQSDRARYNIQQPQGVLPSLRRFKEGEGDRLRRRYFWCVRFAK